MLPEFWKEIREPSDIYASLAPILQLTFLFGVTPFSISGRRGQRKLKITCLAVFIVFLNLFAITGCYIKTVIDGESLVGYFIHTNISKLGNIIQLITGFFGISVIYSVCLRKWRELVIVLRNLAYIDEQLLSLGVLVKYKKLLYYTYRHFILKIFLTFIHVIISYGLLASVNVFPSFFAYMSFAYPHIITTTVAILFSCVTRLIDDRFVMINQVSILGKTNILGVVSNTAHTSPSPFVGF